MISQLSGDVQEAFLQNVRNIKLDGCIKHFKNSYTIGQLLEKESEIGTEYCIRNNSLYRVCVEDEGMASVSATFRTTDGAEFSNTDYIIVHKSDASIKRILPDDLKLSDIIVVKTGVSKIDLDTEAFLRLSSDNNLSTYIWGLDNSITLSSGGKDELSNTVAPESLSVLTKVTQTDGKVTFEAKPLLSSDVAGLSGWVKAKIEELDVDKTVLTADGPEKLSVITSIKENDGKISIEYKPLEYTDVSGLTGYVDGRINELDYGPVDLTSEGTKIITKIGETDGKISVESKRLISADVLGIDTYVSHEFEERKYDSHDLFSDSSDIISVITELKQVDGKISYTTKPLDYTNVSGLTGYVNEKIGGLDVSADISAVSADHKLVYCVTEEDGKISTYSRCLTSADFYDDDLSVWNKLCVDLVDGLPEICSVISTEVHKKIWIKNPTGDATLSEGAYSDLSVIKLPKEEYEQKVIDGTLNESCLYVVSSDYIDAYGEPLCNLTMPEGYEGVAVTKPYVDEKLGSIETGVDGLLA